MFNFIHVNLNLIFHFYIDFFLILIVAAAKETTAEGEFNVYSFAVTRMIDEPLFKTVV